MAETVPSLVRSAIRVRGLVQGVGFRPTVWRLANEEGITGFVRNDAAGVAIEATGSAVALERFYQRLQDEAPPLARIESVDVQQLASLPSPPLSFAILASEEGVVATGIVADAATCPACLAECFDRDDRRHGYAFTNCTHCGPRLSIVEAIPYDRATTTMAPFEMCADCAAEYADPADRRFHAQPNACPVCGPRVWLEEANGARAVEDALDVCAQMIADGKIVAVKGIGGFHLACDATNADVVDELRRRKARDDKPLALMVQDVKMARSLAIVGDREGELLGGAVAPIVLLERQPGVELAPGVAPGQGRIGVMLPYTPLHHLLLTKLARPLVMTSGNLSNEPQCVSNDDARWRLAGIADGWLMHDREIANRLDDSVVRSDAHGPTILRRARGFAPEPLRLADGFVDAPAILALGGELKATFAMLRSGTATPSQHLGDLEEPATCADYRKTLDLYRDIFEFVPEAIAIDKHPDYASSGWGTALAAELGVPVHRVQHHHAHLASVLAENGVAPDCTNVLGIILDGTGLGDDGTIWGAEFLLGGYRAYQRVGHFAPVGLAGGAAAVREPWRNTFAHLHKTGVRAESVFAHPILGWLNDKPVATLEKMLAQGLNTPLASSAGRLFDAVAGGIGVCRERQTYEGQAAMELEALATPEMVKPVAYPFSVGDGAVAIVDFAPMWPALLSDLEKDCAPGVIAARFHATVIDAVTATVEALAERRAVEAVALSGGVFQNRLLLDGVGGALEARGYRVLRHRRVPANDGGLSLGQAAVVAAQTIR